MEIVTKQATYGFTLSKFDVQQGEISAVVTSFKNKDVVNDVIVPGALDTFLGDFEGGLPMLFQHSQNDIVGQWDRFDIKGDLVVGTGTIYPEVSKGADAMALISRGMIGSTSIGFRATDWEYNDDGGRDFKEISLHEVSLVQMPANPKAEILQAKNDDGHLLPGVVERILRDAGLSRKESKLSVALIKDALRDVAAEEEKAADLLAEVQLKLNGGTI